MTRLSANTADSTSEQTVGTDRLTRTAIRQEPLRSLVADAVRNYLSAMEGHDVEGLYAMVLNEIEPPLLEVVLDYSGGNQSWAAKLLGISRASLRKKLVTDRLTRTAIRQEPLRSLVADAVRNYLSAMEGHDVEGLYAMVLNEIEPPLLEVVLDYSGGNQSWAAKLLGISRASLRKKKKLVQHGIIAERSASGDESEPNAESDTAGLYGDIPLRIYLGSGDEKHRDSVLAAVQKLYETYGLLVREEYQEERGSWFKKFILAARKPEVLEELKHRLKQSEHIIELELLSKRQAQVDKAEAEALVLLIKSLAPVKNAVLQVGSLLMVKSTDPSNSDSLIAKTLTTRELNYLNANQHLLMQPSRILEVLNREQSKSTNQDRSSDSSSLSAPSHATAPAAQENMDITRPRRRGPDTLSGID
jgi:Fis family transcriptional regulator